MTVVAYERSISVVICTRARAALLDDLLQSLGAVERPPGWRWEVVVLDHASNDATADVLRSHLGRLPLRIEHCAAPELASARNAAFAAATGEWLVMLDDDVLVEPGWLIAFVRALEADPDVAFGGGRIEAQFDGRMALPVRLAFPHVRNFYSILPADSMRQPPGVELVPYGANLVFKREWAARFPFDLRTGYQPGRPPAAGEETEIMRRMLSAGGRGIWIPDAVVRHRLPGARLRTRWLLRRLRGAGLEAVVLGLRPGRGSAFGVPLHVWLDVLRFLAGTLTAALTFRVPTALGRAAWLTQRCWVAYYARRARRDSGGSSGRGVAVGATVS
jgi:glycosyltransferase involved in cell wall biosynthesis